MKTECRTEPIHTDQKIYTQMPSLGRADGLHDGLDTQPTVCGARV